MKTPRSHRHLVVRGGTVVAMDPARRVAVEDVLITDGEIVAVGRDLPVPPATRSIDARGLHVLPGLIQGHVHLGQSLFRGLAEDRELLSWLEDRIWPLEAAHTEESAYRSGMLGAVDCLLGGTTTVQEIGLVRGMEGIFRAIDHSGLRAVAGKCLMDTGRGVPAALVEKTGPALEEAADFVRRWSGEARGRISTAVCPRFILSCTRDLWEGAVALSTSLGVPIHTHLLESEREAEAVRAAVGMEELEYLDQAGVLDTDLRIAHGVWLTDSHLDWLEGRSLGVCHCPSSNLKLGSGVADLVFLSKQDNIKLGLGTDGAPCNNDMDMLGEMRLAGLLQQLKQGPGKFSAEEVVAMATIHGAAAVGLEDRVGSLAPGKAGDLVVLDLERPQTFGPEGVTVYDRIVYGAARDAVRYVVVDGELLVENGRLAHLEMKEILAKATEELRSLLERAPLN